MAQQKVSQLRSLADLLTSVGLLNEETNEATRQRLVDKTLRELKKAENEKGGLRNEWIDVEAKLKGLTTKARILVHDDLANSLDHIRLKLQLINSVNPDPTKPSPRIQPQNIPAHLAFLLALSNSPSTDTYEYAETLMAEVSRQPMTEKEKWEEIFGTESSEDERRQQDAETERWSDWSSEGSFGEDDDTSSPQDERDVSPVKKLGRKEINPKLDPVKVRAELEDERIQKDLDALLKRAYWNSEDSRVVLLDENADVSASAVAEGRGGGWEMLTSELSLPLALKRLEGLEDDIEYRYLSEIDAVREVLFSLCGNKSTLFTFTSPTSCAVVPATSLPCVSHLSVQSFKASLEKFSEASTTMAKLRNFVSVGLTPSASSKHKQLTHVKKPGDCSTLDALSEGIETFLNRFSRWVAQYEQGIIGSSSSTTTPKVISLLSLSYELLPLVKTASVLLAIIESLPSPTATPPHLMATAILDILFRSAELHMGSNDLEVATELESLLIQSAEPLWRMIGNWLRDGMSTQIMDADIQTLPAEFFITEGETIVTSEPELWTSYILNNAESAEYDGLEGGVPILFGDSQVGKDILAAGKAVGILRTLRPENLGEAEIVGKQWLPLSRILCSPNEEPQLDIANNQSLAEPTTSSSFFFPSHNVRNLHSPETPSLKQINHHLPDFMLNIKNVLQPRTQELQSELLRIIINDWAYREHLWAIEGLFAMRRGGVLGSWSDEVFRRMDTGQNWSDPHSLTLLFRDLVAEEEKDFPWINSALVRFLSTTRKFKKNKIRAFQCLSLHYSIPFPLSIAFTKETFDIRSSIFIFLLQLKRARCCTSELVLLRIPSELSDTKTAELKAYLALKTKLIFILNHFWDFFMHHILDHQIQAHHIAVDLATSFDELIELQHNHVANLNLLFFLSDNTRMIYRAIQSIFDIALSFATTFKSFLSAPPLPSPTSPATGDESMRSGVDTSITSSRYTIDVGATGRRRKKKRGIWSNLSSDDDNTGNGTSWRNKRSPSEIGFTTEMFESGDFLHQMSRMDTQLADQVRFLKTSIDLLVGVEDDGMRKERWGRLSFALEDWKE